MSAAIRWYDEISPNLGNRFRELVDQRFDEIAVHPESFAIAFDDVRFSLIPRFPYLLLFRKHRDFVYVLGVFHGASDPEKWRQRAESS